MIVAEVEEVTEVVVTVNVAVLLPAATVTEPGIVADALSLDNATETPPAGAGPLKVIVPVDAVPAVTLAGLREREASVTPGAAVSDKVTVEPAAMTTVS